MRNLMIKLEYDGTNYNGWQIQPNGITIQEELMKAVKKLTGQDVTIYGSGRTDARVHARGQVANFHIDSNVKTQDFLGGLNHFLPQDIVILEVKEVAREFHARYWAQGKIYSYQVYNHPQRGALNRNYTYHISHKLDLSKMEEAGKLLIGKHNFKGFMNSGSNVESTVRTIYDLRINKRSHNIYFILEGNGFLYNMVRIIVGTLIEVGMGKRELKLVEEALKTGNRDLAGHTVPAQGLFLDKVLYPLTLQEDCIKIN